MPVINGQKFACESCVKGHRVSNCNHYERELKLIAPKGRPVKQCDHCRTARKSKSHHAKCDCGNKKEKKESKSDLRKENAGCCCHKGEQCLCGNKNESIGTRIEKALSRPTHSVQSKPRLNTIKSDSKLTVFSNGHHAPVHRNNNLAHTSGAPYKIPRPHTLHGAPAFMKGAQMQEAEDNDSRSVDDMFGLNSNKVYSLSSSGSNSQESLRLAKSEYPLELSPVDSNDMSSMGTEYLKDLGLDARAGQDFSWVESSLSTVPETPHEGLAISPNFNSEFDWSTIPSDTLDYFMPSDLPLVSPDIAAFAQTISHSDESNYAPGLTSGSSGAQSDNGLDGFWQDTIQVRNNASDRWPSSLAEEYSFGSQATSSRYATSSTAQSRHLSDSSTTTAFHLGSLGTEPEQEDNDNDNAIMIPSGDETDDWTWQGNMNNIPQSNDISKEYGWLLDS